MIKLVLISNLLLLTGCMTTLASESPRQRAARVMSDPYFHHKAFNTPRIIAARNSEIGRQVQKARNDEDITVLIIRDR